MIRYIHGNLLDSKCQYICHQVNCYGAMNSGVAKQIRNKWPEVFSNYSAKYQYAIENNKPLLGDIQAIYLEESNVPYQMVINLFAQERYGYDGQQYTSYDAFWKCLLKLKDECSDGTFAFPYKIASDRGGANWNVIRTMIEEVFYDREVCIYYLSEVDLLPEDRKRAELN